MLYCIILYGGSLYIMKAMKSMNIDILFIDTNNHYYISSRFAHYITIVFLREIDEDFPKGFQLYSQFMKQILLYTYHDFPAQIALRL